MASKTFANLAPAKQNRIRQALLTEFSQHDLADAQVARIVKQAGIARGAFYKYFADLTDAYNYLYHFALLDLHNSAIKAHRLLSADEYTQEVANFLDRVNTSPYAALVKRHFMVNEALLCHQESRLRPVSPLEWGVMTLVHQAIKDGLTRPDQEQVVIARLRTVLRALLAKENKNVFGN